MQNLIKIFKQKKKFEIKLIIKNYNLKLIIIILFLKRKKSTKNYLIIINLKFFSLWKNSIQIIKNFQINFNFFLKIQLHNIFLIFSIFLFIKNSETIIILNVIK